MTVPESGSTPGSALITASGGMVATSQPQAARIGVEVLGDGGSAVDAAIAANAALGLMEPTGCGIGGDLFALIWDHGKGELVALDGSGRASASVSLDERRARFGDRLPDRGGSSVSVPGAVDGWFRLHERFGRLSMERLLRPAIEVATDGFVVTPVIARAWQRAEIVFADRADFGATFLPDGRAPRAGERFRNPRLADTYERLIAGGRDAFYTGEVAARIVASITADGGVMTTDDLAGHSSSWVAPISTTYRGHEVWELPPPGQGLAALQMFALLEGWPSLGNERTDPLDPDRLHLMIEAKKLAYEDRARYYADPAFGRVPVEALLSAGYTERRRSTIDPQRASGRCEHGAAHLETGDTVYMAVADGNGNLASWIQSNYMGFGAGLVPEALGFGLQNRGRLFSLDPTHGNALAPGKRPFHTIIPAMLTRNGRPVFCFGVMGGAFQPQGHVQIVSHLLDAGLDVRAVGDVPRWRHEGSSDPTGEVMVDGGVVKVEAEVPDQVVEALVERGHVVERDVEPEHYGGYQGIVVEQLDDPARRVYSGGSESRKDGAAVGL